MAKRILVPLDEAVEAESMVGAFQPARLAWAFPVLFVLGVAAAIRQGPVRLTLVPAAAAIGLILLSVALVGGVPRYRYPEDPLIWVVIVVGLTEMVRRTRRRAPAVAAR